MAEHKTLRSLSRLLSYPDEQTVEAAELLYIILQGELPEAATQISEFGSYLEQHTLTELEEKFTQTFDISPTCALEVGWHLFGEEYARGMFLVRMREELRKYNLAESTELPDHIVHVLSIIAEMPKEAAERFVQACVLPAALKMQAALEKCESPYEKVVSAMVSVLHHVWGSGEVLVREDEHPDANAIPEGVDLLHAYPVSHLPAADVNPVCGEGCCSSSPSPELVPLSMNPSVPDSSSDRREPS